MIFSRYVYQYQLFCALFCQPVAFQVLKDANDFFSRSTPNLATVIPAMDYICGRLSATNANNQALSPAIKASLSPGEKSLDRYYSSTDACPIAMGVCLSFFSSRLC